MALPGQHEVIRGQFAPEGREPGVQQFALQRRLAVNDAGDLAREVGGELRRGLASARAARARTDRIGQGVEFGEPGGLGAGELQVGLGALADEHAGRPRGPGGAEFVLEGGLAPWKSSKPRGRLGRQAAGTGCVRRPARKRPPSGRPESGSMVSCTSWAIFLD